MYVIEETHIINGVATPLQQMNFANYIQAADTFNSFQKQTEDHYIVMFDSNNPFQAIGMK